MTQIASLLAVATAFIDLWTPFYSRGGGGGGGDELKMHGGLCARGGA